MTRLTRMKKIGDFIVFPVRLRIVLLSLSLTITILSALFYGQSAAASDARATASVSSTHVMLGERFTLHIELQSREPRNVSRPELPELDGMRFVSTVPQTTTSYSLVNGVAQMTYRYSYTIQATDSGAYHIPEVYLNVDGEEHATRPVTIVIQTPEDGEARQPRQRVTQQPSIFLELEIDEEQPVRGQQIVAEMVLYFRNNIDVNSFHVLRSWQTEGFWREDLNESQTRRAESVVLQGQSYRRAVIARYALFPTRTGELSIPSYAIRASIRQSSRESSSLFDGYGRRREVNVESSPRTLQVHSPPLPPSDGQHISALGQFTIERSLSQDRIKLGEAVDVITEIQGSGNLGLITRPSYEYPPAFDTHRPRETVDRNMEAPRMAGTKQFRDVLIARNTGTFTIPETTVHTYNDALRRYEAHTLPELTLEIARDPNARVTMAQRDDFRLTPARGSVTWTRDSQSSFLSSWVFWFALVLPLALFVMGYRQFRYKQKLAGDKRFERYERAPDQALSLLEQAGRHPNHKSVYSNIHKALNNFITDRLDLPAAGVTEQELTQELRKRNVEQPLCDRVYRLLNKCATIRYAPDPSSHDTEEDISEAHALISQLKMQL